MTISSLSRWAFTALMVSGLAVSADAQGKAKGNDKKPDDKSAKAAAKADDKRDKAVAKSVKKRVTTPQAVLVTREVLIANGYQIVRVAPSGTSQIIYYRRGNMGKGKGLGPVQQIVVVPAGEVVRFQAVPEPLLVTILRRLGM